MARRRSAASRALACVVALACVAFAGASAESGEQRAPLEQFAVHSVRRQLASGVSLSCNASSVARSGSWVSVTWAFPTSGSPSPSATDVLALYVPFDADITRVAPVKFKNVTGSRGGSLSFRLLNLRQSAKFVYFTGGSASPVAVAVVRAPAFANVNEPTGVHLALTGRPDELRVTWSSWNSSLLSAPRCRWGLDKGATPGVALASTRTYSSADLCANPDSSNSTATGKGFLAPGQLHSAVLGPLPPSTRVWYSCGSDAAGWSDLFAFTSPPRPGARVALAAVADMGQADPDGSNYVAGNPTSAPYSQRSYYSMQPSLATAAALAAEVASGRTLVLHNGDLSYGIGYGALWEQYADQTQAAAASAPWMTAVGNHEHNWAGNPWSGRFNSSAAADSGGECGVPYVKRYPMPPPADSSPSSPWYSFDYGIIHFTTMSTEHPFAPGTPQYAFLQADLAAAAAARDAATVSGDGRSADAPRWLVFNGHRPFFIDSPYNTGVSSDTPVAIEMARVLEPLWTQYGVDLTLTGHHHSYQRSVALAYGVQQSPCEDSTEAGTRHVVLGNGGARLSGLGGPQASLMEVTNATTFGYVRIDADARSLTLSAVASASGLVFDQMVLRKAPGPRTCLPEPPSFDLGMPPLDKSTLIIALVASSLIAVSYGVRACMMRLEDGAQERHAHQATAQLLEQRNLAAREFAEEEKRAEGEMKRFQVEREEAARARAEALQAELEAASVHVAPPPPPPPPPRDSPDDLL